jgi:hypothetical protein
MSQEAETRDLRRIFAKAFEQPRGGDGGTGGGDGGGGGGDDGGIPGGNEPVPAKFLFEVVRALAKMQTEQNSTFAEAILNQQMQLASIGKQCFESVFSRLIEMEKRLAALEAATRQTAAPLREDDR